MTSSCYSCLGLIDITFLFIIIIILYYTTAFVKMGHNFHAGPFFVPYFKQKNKQLWVFIYMKYGIILKHFASSKTLGLEESHSTGQSIF